jgi:hypothetical protein
VRTRVLAGLWLVAGVAIWNGFVDIYVSRGAREYGQKQAEADLGLGPKVSMTEVMANATHDGVVAGSLWAIGIVVCGWATTWLSARKNPGTSESRNPGTPQPRNLGT